MAAKKVMKLMVFSKEIIKPSSPTPSHLQTFKLSFIDQLIPPIPLPLIFFYRSGGDIHCRRLKKSLSETLNHFYPVAGRLSADLNEIKCHDEGATYHQVRANVPMSEALQKPEKDVIDHLIPNSLAKEEMTVAPLLKVQATYFECGGVAIGLSMSHKVVDGTSLHIFVKAWSRASLGNKDLAVPDFTASSDFPAQHPIPFQIPLGHFDPEISYIVKRFVIDASKMRDLKAKAASEVVPHPTRTEVMSALLWKCSLKAVARSSQVEPAMLTWPVNIRSMLTPPLSDSSMGNIFAMLLFRQEEERRSLATLVSQLRLGMEEFRAKYMKDQLEGGREQATLGLLSEYSSKFYPGAHWSAHSSVCGLRFYDIDFGWGKPAWVSVPISSSFPNLAVFTDTPGGGGVEALVTLAKQDADMLEHDQEFLEFVSLNPSPLQEYK